MTEKTIPIRLPLEVWGRLASRADTDGVTVADLIADAIQTVAGIRPKRGIPAANTLEAERLAIIRPLRAAGWTWAQIVAQTGIPMSSAMAIAKKHGLTRKAHE